MNYYGAYGYGSMEPMGMVGGFGCPWGRVSGPRGLSVLLISRGSAACGLGSRTGLLSPTQSAVLGSRHSTVKPEEPYQNTAKP